jgi:hypothetical protein
MGLSNVRVGLAGGQSNRVGIRLCLFPRYSRCLQRLLDFLTLAGYKSSSLFCNCIYKHQIKVEEVVELGEESLAASWGRGQLTLCGL